MILATAQGIVALVIFMVFLVVLSPAAAVSGELGWARALRVGLLIGLTALALTAVVTLLALWAAA